MALREHWPETTITWLIGKLEHRLVGDLPGVEFIVFDKAARRDGFRAVREKLAGRKFAALLHMQVALRANLLSLLVIAVAASATTAAIEGPARPVHQLPHSAAQRGEHVLDAMASFLEPGPGAVPGALGHPDSRIGHGIRRTTSAGRTAHAVISPTSSHRLRNWRPERYAAVADHAMRELGWRVVLCGGPSAFEREFGDAILGHMHRVRST